MGGDRRNEKGKKREQSAAISAAKKGERIDIRAGERLDNLLKDGWGKWNSERGRKIHWEGVFVLFLMLSTEYLLYIFRHEVSDFDHILGGIDVTFLALKGKAFNLLRQLMTTTTSRQRTV